MSHTSHVFCSLCPLEINAMDKRETMLSDYNTLLIILNTSVAGLVVEPIGQYRYYLWVT